MAPQSEHADLAQGRVALGVVLTPAVPTGVRAEIDRRVDRRVLGPHQEAPFEIGGHGEGSGEQQ